MAVKLDSAGAALRIGVMRSTFYRYVTRPEMHVPPPDGRKLNGRPWWWDSTIDAWNEARPGPGYRSDRVLSPDGDEEGAPAAQRRPRVTCPHCMKQVAVISRAGKLHTHNDPTTGRRCSQSGERPS